MKESICTVLGSLIDSLSRQIMLRKVTLMALLGVAVAEVSNYDSVHSPYTYDSVHSPYTTKYDPLQHYFGVRQDGLLNMDPMIAGLGVVSRLVILCNMSNQPSMKIYHKDTDKCLSWSTSILCIASPHVCLQGVLNAGYTTIVSLLNAQKTRNVCNKVSFYKGPLL